MRNIWMACDIALFCIIDFKRNFFYDFQSLPQATSSFISLNVKQKAFSFLYFFT